MWDYIFCSPKIGFLLQLQILVLLVNCLIFEIEIKSDYKLHIEM